MSKDTQNANGQNTKLLLNLPRNDMRTIERLVRIGRFSTKSEAIRFAIKKALEDEERMRRFDEAARVVENRVKELGLTRKDIARMIEEVKDETRKEVRKMMKERGVRNAGLSNSSTATKRIR